ncbi:MAG: carboxypeptidase-like regulatory domain-containing protein [Acidobacteriaceae bacterium]
MILYRFPGMIIFLFVAGVFVHAFGAGQEISALAPQPATVIGTVLDVNGGVVPGASVVLGSSNPEHHLTTTSDSNGFFQFAGVPPGSDWHVTVRMRDFASWISKPFVLIPGQYFLTTGVQLRPAIVEVSVTALTPEQVATDEVQAEEKQRVLGVIPNFYVAYDRNPMPLTVKLKFQLAWKALTDPVTIAGFALNATIYQAAHYPDYREGVEGYGQRLGSTFAGGYTNVLIGDALLPSILHQDPRYFYQGTGTTWSRLLHALSSPLLTYGDNGRRQINVSGIGGDLASGAIANAYYPSQERGGSLVFKSALIGAGGRVANGLLQEFVLRRLGSRGSRK